MDVEGRLRKLESANPVSDVDHALIRRVRQELVMDLHYQEMYHKGLKGDVEARAWCDSEIDRRLAEGKRPPG